MSIEGERVPCNYLERTNKSWTGELEGISIAGGRDADHERCKNHEHNSLPPLAITFLYHLCPPLSFSNLHFEVYCITDTGSPYFVTCQVMILTDPFAGLSVPLLTVPS